MFVPYKKVSANPVDTKNSIALLNIKENAIDEGKVADTQD